MVALLFSERLNRTDAGHRLNEMHNQLGRGDAGLSVVNSSVLLKPTSQEEKRYQRNHNYAEAAQIEQGECHRCKDHVENSSDHFVAAGVEKFFDCIEVAGLASDYATRGVFLVKLQTQLLSVHKDAVSQIIDNTLVGLGSVEQEPCDQNAVCGGGKQERTDGKQ